MVNKEILEEMAELDADINRYMALPKYWIGKPSNYMEGKLEYHCLYCGSRFGLQADKCPNCGGSEIERRQ